MDSHVYILMYHAVVHNLPIATYVHVCMFIPGLKSGHNHDDSVIR